VDHWTFRFSPEAVGFSELGGLFFFCFLFHTGPARRFSHKRPVGPYLFLSRTTDWFLPFSITPKAVMGRPLAFSHRFLTVRRCFLTFLFTKPPGAAHVFPPRGVWLGGSGCSVM